MVLCVCVPFRPPLDGLALTNTKFLTGSSFVQLIVITQTRPYRQRSIDYRLDGSFGTESGQSSTVIATSRKVPRAAIRTRPIRPLSLRRSLNYYIQLFQLVCTLRRLQRLQHHNQYPDSVCEHLCLLVADFLGCAAFLVIFQWTQKKGR